MKKLVGKIPVSKLRPGGKLRLTYPPYDVLVVQLENGDTHAIEDACSHAGASLAEGKLKDGKIACPMHGYIFDVRTGKLLIPRGLCPDQRPFEVIREGDEWAIYDRAESPLVGGRPKIVTGT